MSSSFLRLSLSVIVGILLSALVFIIFTINFLKNHLFIVIPLAITIIAFLSSLGINMSINSGSCPSLNIKRCSLSALITTGVAGALSLMFVGIEPIFPLFAFPFNPINFSSSGIGVWKMASIFGFAFALFWLTTSAQLFATGISESCD